jgi:hypothetical protein
VATLYEKQLCDGPAHLAWKARFREELGDVLWYVAALATKLGLDRNDMARANLSKVSDRCLVTPMSFVVGVRRCSAVGPSWSGTWSDEAWSETGAAIVPAMR